MWVAASWGGWNVRLSEARPEAYPRALPELAPAPAGSQPGGSSRSPRRRGTVSAAPQPSSLRVPGAAGAAAQAPWEKDTRVTAARCLMGEAGEALLTDRRELTLLQPSPLRSFCFSWVSQLSSQKYAGFFFFIISNQQLYEQYYG